VTDLIPATNPSRRLTLIDVRKHGKDTNRSALTCRFKCGNACDHDIPNPTDNPYFGDVLAASVNRRGLLRVGAVIGAAGLAGAAGANALPAAADDTVERAAAAARKKAQTRGLAFTTVPPNAADRVTVPPGYSQEVVIRWGDPILNRTPELELDTHTAAAQRGQFGYNNDFLGLLPLNRDTQLLCANHEYTDEVLMFRGYDADHPTRAQVEIAWAAHGLSVVAVRGDRWSGGLKPVVGHSLNRRLHTRSEFRLTGPVAGSRFVKTSADPQGRTVLGTLNNCSGGLTPWGTWLTAEENFNQYFGNAEQVTNPVVAARLARYGIAGGASDRQWETFDRRFDLTKDPNEVNRFGWIIEVDPYDPESTPVKHTMLGRFKHEAANVRVAKDGRVTVYLGDDERFDYLYKFVSAKKMIKGRSARARRSNATLLETGTLYVAKFHGDSPASEIDGTGALPADGAFDGWGEWVALTTDEMSHVPGMSVAEVLCFTRQAGDKIGATKMDRPEDVEPSPVDGTVYIACTNNSDRGKVGKAAPDEANPRSSNKHGHVIELVEKGNDSAAQRFSWGIFLVCGDPDDPGTYFGGFDKAQVSPISCPDNVAFDPYGNLWISTDGNALGVHDGLFGVATEGRTRGQVKQFLSVPTGAETCGPVITAERVLVAVQHPGETDGSTADAPSSAWPDGPGRVPRPSVVAVWPNDRRRKVGEV
jgi:secreted PhoX family phosphatase